jgi:hypothetical protein
MIDFDACERVRGHGYRGNAGRKLPYLHEGGLWMVKFPGSTKNMAGAHLPSYTSSPISEYIGSHIYGALGIDVHETVLGRCAGKIVVGCRDFTEHAALLEYSQIKNTVDDEFISGSYGSSAAGERLGDVVRVIGACEEFEGIRDAVLGRFWDMFVVDAFIHNNDRNNGNWGLLVSGGCVALAPVYDNGNAFFNKRGADLFRKRLDEERLLREDALSGRSFFLDDADERIDPFAYLSETDDEDCIAALLRFAERLDLDEIFALVDEVPNKAFGLDVIHEEQRAFYKGLLQETYREGLLPAIERHAAAR